MQRLIFLLILTLLLIKPTANAIFLSKVGVAALPVAYIMVAVLAFVFTLFYNRHITKASPIQLFYRSIQLCIAALVAIGVILCLDGFDILGAYLFYLFISIFGILSASQFWILANQIFDAREARKYFGIIGFGAIAGGIVGGYLASAISTLLQSEVIPFVAAALLVVVLRYIRGFAAPTREKATVPAPPSLAASFREPVKLIAASKHLSYIALIIATSVFTSKLIDFQFGFFATAAYPVEEDLTAFYGIMYSTFNLAAIVIQVLLTTRIIGRLGIGYSLIILPTILVMNAGLLLVLPGLLLVSGLKLAEASMKQSINKASVELIMLPVPKDIKLRTKTFLDVFVDSIATGLSGIVLIVLLQSFQWAQETITAMILASTVLWLYLANKVRREYLKVFRKSLKLPSDGDSLEHTTIVESYQKVLAHGDDFQVQKALGFLIEHPVAGLEQSYLRLLQSSNPNIIKAATDILSQSKADYSLSILPLLDHENQNVRIAAFEYIINHQEAFSPNFLIDHINSPDMDVKIIALAAYAKEYKNDPRSLSLLRIEDRLDDVISNIESSSLSESEPLWIGVLKTIGYGKFAAKYPIIDRCLQSDSITLRQHALAAAGETQASAYLKRLAAMLDTPEPPIAVVKALAKYSVPRLDKILTRSQQAEQLDVLRNMSKVLELKPSQAAIRSLEVLIEHPDMQVRNHAINSLRVLSDLYPLLQINKSLIHKTLIEECRYTNEILSVLSLYSNTTEGDLPHERDLRHPLLDHLTSKVDANLTVIFELLHMKYPPENYLELYDYVRGADTELRNNALEYVDNSLTYDLKSTIVPLLEFVTEPYSTAAVENTPESRKKIKAFLLSNRDEQIRTLAESFYQL